MRPYQLALHAAIVAAFPGLCLAQSADSARSEDVVVTATRFEQPERDTPIGVRVIDREAIERSGVTTVADLLSLQPGFSVRNLDGGPDYQLDLGGFGITGDQNTLILVDGQRISELDLSAPRLSTIPLSSIERIEIIQGSGAVLYGGGTTGGVVNIITRSPQVGDREVTLKAGAGTYNTRDAEVGGSIASQQVGVNVNGSYYESDNYRDNNAIRQQSADATVRTMSKDYQLILKAATDDQDLRLPGPRTAQQLITDRRGTSTPDDSASQRGNRAGLTAGTNVGPAELALDLSYRDTTKKSNFVSEFFYLDAQTEVYQISPRLKLPHRLFGMDNALIAGVDWSDSNYHSTSAASPDTINLPFSITDLEQRTLAGYLQYTAALTRSTLLNVGGRIQNTATDTADAVALTAQSQTREVRAYDISLRQNFTPDLSVWAKLGQSFRFPTVDEDQDTFPPGLLEPQLSHDKQLGIEYQKERTRLRAMVFRSDLTNEIAFAPLFTFCCNTNLPPTRHEGFELEGSQRLAPWLQVSANYTYTIAEFEEGVFSGVNVAGNEIPLVPRHKANAGVLIEPMPHLWFRADVQYVGTQRFDNDQTNQAPLMPAYTVVNLSSGYDIDSWRFELIVRNLFNKDYFTYAIVSSTNPASGNYNALPAAERSFFLAARYRF
ncbi:MAG TPA: TonB-dependent receptor, partial [Burkholderiales bacterium]|nr:TonB-dependent receptor [Burkholderiales bacterium]